MKFAKLVVGMIVVAALFGVTNHVNAQNVSFSDVSKSHWGYEGIQWGIEQEIVSGYEDGTFRPNNTVTEAEFISLLVRAYGIEVPVKENQRWSEPYYDIAYQHNLPVNYYTGTINRQEVANIIVGTRGVNFSGDDAITYMLNKGFAQGKTSKTIEGYRGLASLTRAEAIVFLKNMFENTTDKTMRARPFQSSPIFLLDYAEEFQLTNPKIMETLERTVQHFNEGIKAVKLDSVYEANFRRLDFNEAAYNQNTTYRIYSVLNSTYTSTSSPSAYTLSITIDAHSGELEKVTVIIYVEGKQKEIIQSAISALIQDKEASTQFYERQQLSTLIDNKLKANNSSNNSSNISSGFQIKDGQYEAFYSQLFSNSYWFTISKVRA